MRRNRKFPARGKVESEEVCRIAPSVLLSGDMLSDIAFGDTLAGSLQDGLTRKLQGDLVNIEQLQYRGLS